MTNRRKAGLVAAALGLVAAAWLILSPRMALSGMREALRTGDSATIDSYIDYDALRMNLREQVAAQMARELSRGKGLEPIDPVAARAALAYAAPMVDRMIQPETVKAMLSRPGGPLGTDDDGRGYRRISATGFLVGPATGDGGVVFALQGVHWRMVGIRPGSTEASDQP